MEILNVSAGQTNEEHAAAEAQRRTDLRAESKNAADYFFVAAGLSALATGLLPIRIGVLINVGLVDLLIIYGRPLGSLLPLIIYVVASMWLLVLLGLGFAGRAGQRWAFMAGIALYAVDMLALMLTFSIWAFGVHGFFVFKWYQGRQALREARESAVLGY